MGSDTVCFTVTLRSLIVTALWTIGGVVAVLDAIYEPPLASLAIGFMVGAATISTRSRIDTYAADWKTAYDAGREVSKVRQLH